MKIFITQYALTDGIQMADAGIRGDMAVVSGNKIFLDLYFRKPYWHVTLEEAKNHAEEMRVKKLASLEKQKAKIEKLSFDKEPKAL